MMKLPNGSGLYPKKRIRVTTMTTMMIFIFFIYALMLAPSFFFVLELTVATKLIFDKKNNETNNLAGDADPVKCVILVPAHNEESVLGQTLRNLMDSIDPDDKIIVIADNCTDDTAKVAQNYACTVLQRFNPNLRGKGYALSFGMESIKDLATDVVIVVDSDCYVSKNAISLLKNRCFQTNLPVQSSYLLYSPDGSSAIDRVSAFALYIKNHIRPLGLSALGGSVPITGSGFAVPYALMAAADLASGEIVEDMKLGNDLALNGVATLFLPDAKVRSPLPKGRDAAVNQRQRWEHGHIGMIFKYAPKLFKRGFSSMDSMALMTALDLCILPLTLLLFVNFIMCFLGLIVLIYSGIAIFFMLSLMIFSLIAIMLIVTNALAPVKYLGAKDIPSIVKFIYDKVSLYGALISGRKSSWVKTRRDE
jgi:cellulose synthase/poly-beta-1,6-N-acetylglucosamine synthase-like glycosyltransferase